MFFFSSDILEKVKQATDYNRKKVQEFMLDLIKLMLVGHEAEMAYYKFNIPYVLEKHKRKWTHQISQLRCAMEKADREMARNYTTGAVAIAKVYTL